MAQKKIGAFIALDGEKQFKQAVTDCNKSLTSLKSEMALVKAESDGQANSLEALQKKHEVLGKILDEQKEKESAVQKALDHAKESYQSVGSKLEKYRDDLQQAKNSLEQMKSSTSASSEEIEKQEKAVKDLETALSKGGETYNRTGNRVKDWETKLNNAKAQVVKANTELNKNAAYMKEAETATDHCATSIDAFGKQVAEAKDATIGWSTVLKANLASAAIDTVKGIGASAVAAVTEFEDAANQMQASTGASEAAMEKYRDVLESVYNNNYGDSFDDIASSAQEVVQVMGDMDNSGLQNITESAITLRDTFGMDVNESLRGVDAMMNTMGVTSEEAFDLIAKGAQNGLNKSGELVDNLAEYAPLWAQAGFSAEEMFAILDNGLDSGAYNLDKVNDYVKEFGNSLADGRIGAHLNSFSDSTKTLFYNWKSGKATTKDVFYSVIQDLSTMTNKQEALTIASDTWSALGEDNAMTVITSLNKVNTAYDDVHGTMEKIKEIKYDSLGNKYEQLGRKFKTEVGVPIAEDFLPVAEEGLEILIDNTDKLVPLLGSVIAGFGAFKTASFVTEAATAVKTLTVATEGAATAQAAMNAVAAMNPYVLIASAAAAAVAGIALYSMTTDDAVTDTDNLIQSSQDLNKELQDTAKQMEDTRKDWEDTASSLEAQEGVTNNLVTELYSLQDANDGSEGSHRRMKQIVEELNQLYPELALAINEETWQVTKNREEVEKSIEKSIAYSKAKAAEEKLAEISKNLVDAELKEYEAQQKIGEISEKVNNIKRERNRINSQATDGEVEYQGEVVRTTDAIIDLNSKEEEYNKQKESAEENLKDLKNEYEELNGTYETVTGYMQEQIDKSGEVAQAYSDKAAAAEETAAREQQAAEMEAKAYAEASAQIAESAQNQISIFSEATNLTGEELQSATQKTLENMASQEKAMENWVANLQELSQRGIDEGLMKYLADMGPSGAEYVAQFASMTNDQLDEANRLWNDTMNNAGIGGTLASQLSGEFKTIKDDIYQNMLETSEYGVRGMTDGLNGKADEVATAATDMASGVPAAVEEKLEIESPSKVMYRIGAYVGLGLGEGIRAQSASPVTAVSDMASGAVQQARSVLSSNTFYNMGQNVTAGLAQGILDGQSAVINAVATMCGNAVAEARKDLDIHSPSKVFEEIGEYSAQGFGSGFENQMVSVARSVKDSMDFESTEKVYGTQNNDAGNLESTIENALYNGMIYAMSKVDLKPNMDGLTLIGQYEGENVVQIVIRANESEKIRTGGIGLFE